jgi:hypothetical protein
VENKGGTINVTVPLANADTRLRLGAGSYWIFLLLATHVQQQRLPQHWNLGSLNADSDYLDRNCYTALNYCFVLLETLFTTWVVSVSDTYCLRGGIAPLITSKQSWILRTATSCHC